MTSITLDKNDPEIAKAFEGCKVGDTYTVTVTEDADDMLTLSVEGKATAEEEVAPVEEEAPMRPRYSNPVVERVA